LTTPSDPAHPASGSRQLAIRVGAKTFTGWWVALPLVVFVALLAVLAIWMKPTLRMSLSAALWILFLAYWSGAAKNAAPTIREESAASRAVHTRLLNGSLLLLFLPVPGLRWRFLPLVLSVIVIGLALQALGFGLAMWARRHLGRYWSGAVAVASDHQLVRTGPYRLVRHPIYSAMFAMYAGTTVVSGELHAVVALLILAGAYWRKIPQEERTLCEVFGEGYETYRRKTWALVPGIL
jgi:protein-S-isoprenylcysteine O-methyltransferase Ste14